MSERNAIKARTCTECDVHHTMVSNAFGLKDHARVIRRNRLIEVEKQNAKESKVESAEKVLRESPEESPGGEPTNPGPNPKGDPDFGSSQGGKDEGVWPTSEEVS